jgi:hypothetical protein
LELLDFVVEAVPEEEEEVAGDFKPQLSLRWRAPPTISSLYLTRSGDFSRAGSATSLLLCRRTTNSDLEKLDLTDACTLEQPEAAAALVVLPFCAKPLVSVLISKEEQEGM